MLVVVAVQAMFAAVAGYFVGIGVSLLAARGAEEWVPQFITNIQAMGFYGEGGSAWNILAAGYILCYDVYNYDMQKGLGPDEGLLSRLLSDSRIGPDRLSSATSDQLREVMRLATVDLCPPDGF